jgi:hypothetical protein
MQKSTASYRMSRYTKRMLALGTWASEEQRHTWRRMPLSSILMLLPESYMPFSIAGKFSKQLR